MRTLMLGNEAIAQGAFEAGVRVATAYPGTPSTEITEFLARHNEIDAEWSVNEKVALEIAFGASVAGARSITSMKHVGLNVALDPLMSIAYTGVNGGMVVVVADDPGMHSSQNEQDTRYLACAAKVPVLEPSDSEECRAYVLAAYTISERFDTPVIVRLTTRVAHTQSLVACGQRENVPLRDMDRRPEKYVLAAQYSQLRRIALEARMERIRAFAESTPLNECIYNDRSVGIITGGIAYHYAREAAPEASFFKLGMVCPLPEKAIHSFVASCKTVWVVEELEPVLETMIKSRGLQVIGKEKLPVIGELSSEIIRQAIYGKKDQVPRQEMIGELPGRPPVFCPGCHYMGPFHVLKKLKIHVSGDIGCYTLATFEPITSVNTTICMGASIGTAFGIEKVRGKNGRAASVAIIGDSTFWHSGVTGLIDIVYNKGATTVLILDNSATAMTGRQDNPSTGYTLKGEKTIAIDIAGLAKAIGIQRVFEIDAFDIVRLEEIVSEEITISEPSVIITRRACVLAEKNREHAAPFIVNKEVCNGCGVCAELGCPAVRFNDRLAMIDTTLCAGCSLCALVCPCHAIVSGGKV